nr:WbqC family protein [Roseivirga sp. E12]
MPWLGFFNKINNSDCWIILDHVENNPRDSAFWCRRVKIILNFQPTWLAISLNKPDDGRLSQPINEMVINQQNKKEIRKKVKGIRQSYAQHPYFNDAFPLIEEYFDSDEPLVCRRNIKFIKSVLNELNIKKDIVLSSDLECEKSSTELLVDLVKKVGGDTYLAGGGAAGYQKDELFRENDIHLAYNNFEHPVYPQRRVDEFIAGASIIDAIMNVGFSGVSEVLKGAE